MTPYEQALRIILDASSPLGIESVRVENLLGRVLAHDVSTPFDLPLFDNSAVDGYALGSLGEAEYRLLGDIPAGAGLLPSIGAGEALRVSTGSRIPSGTTSIAMLEDVAAESSLIRLCESQKPGSHIRRKGEELEQGQLVVRQGTLCTPPVVAMVASLGLERVEVFRRPTIGVVGTGSELVAPGTPLKEGEIYESNRQGLEAAILSSGFELEFSRLVRDNLPETAEAIGSAAVVCDLVITCGGASKGEHDLVREAAASHGFKELIGSIAVKPGKPTFFMIRPDGKMLLGMPGNPVPALLGFAIFALPMLRRMMGMGEKSPEFATLASCIRKQPGRLEFVRARLESRWGDIYAHPNELRGSHQLSGLATSDAVVHCPAEATKMEQGETVQITRLNWGLA